MKLINILLLLIVLVSVSTRDTNVKSHKKHKKGIFDSIKNGASKVANGAKNLYNKGKEAVSNFFNGDEEEAEEVVEDE